MIVESSSTWLMLGLLLLHCMTPADVQMAMGMYPSYGQMGQPYPFMAQQMPFPAGMMAVPAAVAIIQQGKGAAVTTTTTTTTTTQAPMRIAVGLPMPVPYPFAVPAMTPPQACQQRPRPPQCPPCPPCLCMPCIPAFFSYCSPCHQKCRCQEGQKPPQPLPVQPQPAIAMPMPMPLPMPMPMPRPIVYVPFSRYSKDDSSSWERSSSEDSCEEPRRRRRRRKGGRLGYRPRVGRRNFHIQRTGGNGLVKPMLSYITQNGDVQFETKLSNVEAIELLRDKPASREDDVEEEGLSYSRPSRYLIKKEPSKIEVKATEDDSGRHRVIVLANQKPPQKLALKNGISEKLLKDGRKELIFNAPKNKKISNMSISFQISR